MVLLNVGCTEAGPLSDLLTEVLVSGQRLVLVYVSRTGICVRYRYM